MIQIHYDSNRHGSICTKFLAEPHSENELTGRQSIAGVQGRIHVRADQIARQPAIHCQAEDLTVKNGGTTVLLEREQAMLCARDVTIPCFYHVWFRTTSWSTLTRPSGSMMATVKLPGQAGAASAQPAALKRPRGTAAPGLRSPNPRGCADAPRRRGSAGLRLLAPGRRYHRQPRATGAASQRSQFERSSMMRAKIRPRRSGCGR